MVPRNSQMNRLRLMGCPRGGHLFLTATQRKPTIYLISLRLGFLYAVHKSGFQSYDNLVRNCSAMNLVEGYSEVGG